MLCATLTKPDTQNHCYSINSSIKLRRALKLRSIHSHDSLIDGTSKLKVNVKRYA